MTLQENTNQRMDASSNASNSQPLIIETSFKSKGDQFWEHGIKLKGGKSSKCKYCNKEMSGGITRLKEHLAGKQGNCEPCSKVSIEIRQKAIELLTMSKSKKEAKELERQMVLNNVSIGDGDSMHGVERLISSSSNIRGPMDIHVYPTPFEASKGLTQSSLSEIKKKERDNACGYIARFIFEAGIAFNVVNLSSFKEMVQAIGLYGPNLKAPSMHEVSEKFLPLEKDKMTEGLKSFKEACRIQGCSLMTDAWADRRGRSIMNLVVNCNSKTIFMHSKNASGEVHNAKYICDFVIEGIKELGEENVVQIVTDNASNNMAASRLLSLDYPTIFWTCCAAHTLNLMLKDIGNIKPIRGAILDGRCITVYIYGHTMILDFMRKCTNQSELIRPGLTRFATSFLSLESLFEKKKELRRMIISEEWGLFSQSESLEHKKVTRIISSPTFWEHVELALKIFEPLVKVLRRADGDIPSMGWLYGDIENAKNDIAEALNHKEKKYKAVWAIIDKRWNHKLKNELHLTGYFLNPVYYYNKREEIENKQDFMDGFSSCLFKMYKNDHVSQDNISKQLGIYQNQEGTFGTVHAIRQRNSSSFNPVTWWKMHGGSAPELKKMAIRVLSLTTSSSGCERAWSAFEMVHTKKRNRLHADKLRDLDFVKFNSQLKSKFSTSTRDALLAPTIHEGVVDEWVDCSRNSNADGTFSDNDTDDEVFPGEGLTWAEVSKAMGNEVYKRPKRAKKKAKTYHGKNSSRKGKEPFEEYELHMMSHEDTSSSSESDSEFDEEKPIKYINDSLFATINLV